MTAIIGILATGAVVMFTCCLCANWIRESEDGKAACDPEPVPPSPTVCEGCGMPIELDGETILFSICDDSAAAMHVRCAATLTRYRQAQREAALN